MQWWTLYVQTPAHTCDAVSAYLEHLGSAAVVLHENATLSVRPEPCVDNRRYTPGSTVLQAAFAGYEALLPRLAAVQRFMAAGAGSEAAPALGALLLQAERPAIPHPVAGLLSPLLGDGWPLPDERLLIRPSWDTSPLPHGKACLTIDPGLAFGTGTHPTTRMCLDMLADYAAQHPGGNLLDAGCGSGILSLAALRLGLRTAVGVDVDPQAVAVAVDNAAANGLQDRAQFIAGWRDAAGGPFDLIVANIFLGPLVEMMPALRRRLTPDGTLIASGIIAPQEAALTASLKAAGLDVCSRMLTDGWIALAARHAQGCDSKVSSGIVCTACMCPRRPLTSLSSRLSDEKSPLYRPRPAAKGRRRSRPLRWQWPEWLVRLTPRIGWPCARRAGALAGNAATLRQDGWPAASRRAGPRLPQGTKMDWIVEKCSELGLSTLVPLHTELSVVRSVGPAHQRENGPLAPYRRRRRGPVRTPDAARARNPSSLADFCARYDAAAVKIICWEHETSRGIRQVLEAGDDRYPVAVLVGPESGFTEDEVAVAQAARFCARQPGPAAPANRNRGGCRDRHHPLQPRRTRSLKEDRMDKIRRALVSVSDKEGVVPFVEQLRRYGIEILSTGGTAATLRERGIPVVPVEDVTGLPEMLGGRVKTLHPNLHGGILAQRHRPEQMADAAAHGCRSSIWSSSTCTPSGP